MNKSIWLALFLTWISWFLSNQSANARETRKEHAGFIEKLQHACNDLENIVLDCLKIKKINEEKRLKIHRMLTELDYMLSYEKLITGKDTWNLHYYNASMNLSDAIDGNASSVSSKIKLSDENIQIFFTEMANLSSAIKTTFVEKYHVEESIWWENKMQSSTFFIIKKFMELEESIKLLINKIKR